MLTNRSKVLISLAVIGFLLVLTVGDFLALHDVQQDYVSPEALHALELDLAGALPYWTATTGEWSMLTISIYSRFVLLIVNALLLFAFLSKRPYTPST
ncbi:MAG: hypothetical protein PVI04_09655 [Anaerolineales bacterium]|jgi:hypothetical protein